MTSRFTSAVVALGLLFLALPGRAQFAYASVAPPKKAVAKSSAVENAKSTAYKLVHGVIQDEQGALPGATVWLHGTRTIAVTNSEGEFELRVPADAKAVKLVCSYGGLQETVLTTAPVQALGSVYLVRPTRPSANELSDE
nr:carboxypeptidase-like regulatory domain-containing protein [Hymenobacter sp. BT770]